MKKMTKRMLIMVGAVVVLVALLGGGFALPIQKIIAASPRPGPQTVTATRVEGLEWQPQVGAVGTMVAVRGVDVTTEIAGLVRSIEFKSGQEVKAGAVLVQLNADSDIAQLRSLQAAADLSATTLARDKEQLAVEAIAQAQVDSDESDLKSRRALVAQQQATIAKKTIVAPFSGRLGITTVNPGQYLNPGDKIVTLQTIDPIYIDFYLPQKQVGGVVLGQVVNVATDSYLGTNFPGRITAINSKVDTATRNVLVEATLPNAKRQLLPGMFANVAVEIGEKKRYLTLPQTAITYNPYGSTVFTVRPKSEVEAEARAASGAASGATVAARRRPRRATASSPSRSSSRPADARRPGRHPQGPEARPAHRHQRPGQAEEQHAGRRRQQRAAGQQPESEAAGTVRSRP